MVIANRGGVAIDTRRAEAAEEARYEKWVHWPVNWSAVWVGALTAVTVSLLLGLIGLALGAHLLDPDHRIVDLKKIGFGVLAFSVFSAFFTFAGAGWVAAKVAGTLRSEPAILHAVIAWVVAVPLLVALAAVGAGSSLGAWQSGLAVNNRDNAAPYERPLAPTANATEEERMQYRADVERYQHDMKQWRDDTPKVTRNTALGAVSALLLGLMGAMLGGWLGSGEPMTFNHHLHRKPRSEVMTQP
jgi:hypothetical protein